MNRRFARCTWWLLLAGLLSACATLPPTQETGPAEDTAPPAQTTPDPSADAEITVGPFEPYRDYRVTESLLTIKVYRSGRLAHLGHNHVITSTQLTGTIHFDDQNAGESYAALRLLVNSLEVDNPEARRLAGEAFERQPSERDIAGTRTNMLGPKLLDAEAHRLAFINVRKAAESTLSNPLAVVQITLAGHTTRHKLPADVLVQDNQVLVKTSFTISHADLGLTPFSALGGAIRVADDMEIELTLVAERP